MYQQTQFSIQELHGADRTLLLPLWARAIETRQPKPLLIDQCASKIIDELSRVDGYRITFAEMERNLGLFYRLSQIFRARCLDDEIRTYIKAHPQATIVNIGAGLDTTFDRVDNGLITWYDLDLPAVMALRRQYLPEGPRRHMVAQSVLDFSWLDQIGECSHGLIMVACGVLFFFNEDQIKRLFIAIADRFPGCELAFDTMSRFFLNIANREVLRQSGMDGRATLCWAVSSARHIAGWDSRFQVLDEYSMYSHTPIDPAWDLPCRFRMGFVNFTKGIKIMHFSI